jgi:hypothetical protein
VPDLRHRLLAAAFELLSQSQQPSPALFTVTIHAADGSADLVFPARPGEFGVEVNGDLSDLHRAILRVLTDVPQSVKVLARLAGYSYSPRFRAGVADLVRRGMAARMPDGIRRAG